MPELKSYDYIGIQEQLNRILGTDIPETHTKSIEYILYGLENEHRMHWIDDALHEDGLTSTSTIFDTYNINLY